MAESDNVPIRITFTSGQRALRPQATANVTEPFHFFKQFFTDKLINGITTETNNYICNKTNWLTRNYRNTEFDEHGKK